MAHQCIRVFWLYGIGVAASVLAAWANAPSRTVVLPYLRHCDAALKLRPSYVLAYLNRGPALPEQKQLLEAPYDFSMACSLDPGNSWAQERPDTSGRIARAT